MTTIDTMVVGIILLWLFVVGVIAMGEQKRAFGHHVDVCLLGSRSWSLWL